MRALVLMLALPGGGMAVAQGTPPAPEGVAAQQPPQSEQGPSLELLEFLGQWETDNGEWIAPEDLADAEFGLLLDASLETEPDESD